MRDGIVPVMEVNGNNGGFGDGNNAWWLIILIILFGGYGRGFGGFGGSGGQVGDNYILASDISMLSRQLSDGFNSQERRTDSIINGICTLGYDNLTQTNTINSNISNVAMSLQNCCCDLKSQLAENRYQNSQNINMLNNNMNAGFTGLQQSMCINTRDIIDNNNANTRSILDFLVKDKIETLTSENQSLRLAASQSAQNEYLLNSLRNGCPVNAQLVCGNQPIPVQYIAAGCNCNNGCGCNF